MNAISCVVPSGVAWEEERGRRESTEAEAARSGSHQHTDVEARPAAGSGPASRCHFTARTSSYVRTTPAGLAAIAPAGRLLHPRCQPPPPAQAARRCSRRPCGAPRATGVQLQSPARAAGSGGVCRTTGGRHRRSRRRRRRRSPTHDNCGWARGCDMHVHPAIPARLLSGAQRAGGGAAKRRDSLERLLASPMCLMRWLKGAGDVQYAS